MITDQEIQSKLLAYYKEHLAAMPTDNAIEADMYLVEKNLSHGICGCAFFVFGGLKIESKDWVRNVNGPGMYWCERPGTLYTVAGMQKALQYRIDILQKLVNAHQTTN